MATWEGEVAGCVALREFAPNAAELRRLYVRPECRSAGIGRQLAERMTTHAISLGYVHVLANTIPAMAHAEAIISQMGYYAIEPYVDDPYAGVRYWAFSPPTH